MKRKQEMPQNVVFPCIVKSVIVLVNIIMAWGGEWE
jgi:hypothetical protein